MEKLTLSNDGRRNYHEVQDICINVVASQYNANGDIELTPAQAKRIANHFCGVAGCTCGSRPAGWEQIDNDRVIIRIGHWL